MNSLNEFWNTAVTYEQYLKDSENKIKVLENATSQEDLQSLEYYQLGLTRMKRVGKTYKPQPELVEKLEKKNFKGKILIISEGWCGDAAMIVPVIHYFFENKNEVKITYRDQNNLIDSYLTNGSKSIPVVLILDENNQPIHHWGPRPKTGMEMLKKYKQNPDTYSAEEFHNDLQIYYTKDKGKEIIEELLEIM